MDPDGMELLEMMEIGQADVGRILRVTGCSFNNKETKPEPRIQCVLILR
jgi:hypothetical protein